MLEYKQIRQGQDGSEFCGASPKTSPPSTLRSKPFSLPSENNQANVPFAFLPGTKQTLLMLPFWMKSFSNSGASKSVVWDHQW